MTFFLHLCDESLIRFRAERLPKRPVVVSTRSAFEAAILTPRRLARCENQARNKTGVRWHGRPDFATELTTL
jgi:hypothetical protein